jgi:predicted phage terminase large subunit-like protein
MCEYLDRFLNSDDFNRLMIFVPPRNGKSELVSIRLPAFALGKYPDIPIIATSYSADLANRFSRSVQSVMDTEEYVDLFPDVRLAGSKLDPPISNSVAEKKTSQEFQVVGRRGVYVSSGVGGPITGKGAKILLIDDPIKNKEEAFSETYREKVWDWFATTAYTRLEKKGKVLVVLTRWHEDDLAGRLLQRAKQNPKADQWRVLTLPAICETKENFEDPRDIGQALWPNKYDISDLESIQQTIPDSAWQALYQQRPTAAEGNIYKTIWLQKTYLRIPAENEFDMSCLSWDMSFKDRDTSDYVVGYAMARKGTDIYILEEVREIMDFPTTLDAFVEQCKRYPWILKKLIEDKANGPAIIATLKSHIMGIEPVDPKGSKLARAHDGATIIRAGNLLLPAPELRQSQWVDGFINELVSFPSGKYDDRVDALNQGLQYLKPKKGLASDPMLVW